MTIFRDNDGTEHIRPSSAAGQARDRWLADNPNYKDRIRSQHTGRPMPTTGEVDELVRRWREAMLTRGTDRLRSALANERLRQARRARRQLRLATTIACLAVGAAVALVVFYGILGYH